MACWLRLRSIFEEVNSVVLVTVGGVITLGSQHGIEGVVGGVVGAGLADGFELAVELGGPVAVAVAEHPARPQGGPPRITDP